MSSVLTNSTIPVKETDLIKFDRTKTITVNSVTQIIQTILKVLYSIQHNPIEILDNTTTIKVEYIDSPILFLRLCKEVSNSNVGSIFVYCDVLNISNDSNKVSFSNSSEVSSIDSNKVSSTNSNTTLKLTDDLIYKSIELGYFKHININLSQLD